MRRDSRQGLSQQHALARFVLVLVLLLLAVTCMVAHGDRTDLARKLLATNNALQWQALSAGRSGEIRYTVEEPLSGRKALIELESDSGELRRFRLRGGLSQLTGPRLSEAELIQAARIRIAQFLPESYGIAGLVASTQPSEAGPFTTVTLRGMHGEVPVPPRVAVQLSDDGKVVRLVLVMEPPVPGLRIGDVKLSPEKAADLAVDEAVRRTVALTGLSERQVQELAVYAPEELPSLYYSNSTLGYCGLPTPGAFYNVKVIRTRPTSTSESDRLLDHLYVTVDANTGQFGAPPEIAGSSTPVESRRSGGSQPIIAFALLALAALLLVFLVVKLRKR